MFKTAAALTVIFAVALALRLAWIANTDTVAPPLSDPQYYHATAQNLADGRGYSVAFDERGFVVGPNSEATAFWPPGYPVALAPLYAIFRDEERIAKVFNAVIGALTVVPVFFIGRHLVRDCRGNACRAPGSIADREGAAGLLAAALFAVMPSLVYWTPVLFSEPLATFGVASIFALALTATHTPLSKDAANSPNSSKVALPLSAQSERGLGGEVALRVLVAIALIATALVKSQALVLIAPVALLLVPQLDLRSIVHALAPVAIVAAAMLVPWMIRNQIAMGEPYAINDNLCYNLRASHAPYSTGGSVPPQDLWDEQPGISFRDRELLFDDLGCGRAWDYAREHPGRELELAPKKVGWLLRSDAADAIEWSQSLNRRPLHRGDADAWVLLGDVFWYPMLVLALLSVVMVPRSRELAALWVALAVWSALHVVFHGEPRYHVPVVPILAALCAGVIVEAWANVRRNTRSVS